MLNIIFFVSWVVNKGYWFWHMYSCTVCAVGTVMPDMPGLSATSSSNQYVYMYNYVDNLTAHIFVSTTRIFVQVQHTATS